MIVLNNITLVLLAAGESTRFRVDVKKQWLRVGTKPLWLYLADRFHESNFFSKIIIVTHPDDIPFVTQFCDYNIVAGGKTRQESLKNALECVETTHIMATDIARCCISSDLIERLIQNIDNGDVIVPTLDIVDTVVYQNETISREHTKRVQTPQLSKTDILKKALKSDTDYTDESSAIVAFGGNRYFIKGEERAKKITFAQDLQDIKCLEAPSNVTLVGNGFDVHAFEDNKPMMLGGVLIDSHFGFRAHSDGDVALHALIDALLGGANMGDIGSLFPDNDNRYKNIDSKELLKECVKKIHNMGYVINNVDITIIAQTPKIAPYKEQMRSVISKILDIPKYMVNIKGTTTEHLGFIGRKEGVGVIASASLNYYDWTKI